MSAPSQCSSERSPPATRRQSNMKESTMTKFEKKRAAAESFLNDNGMAKAFELYVANADGWEESKIVDMVGKLVRFGSWSEKQVEFAKKLLKQIDERPAREAAKAAEDAAAAPVPETTGRVLVEGEVLTVKYVETRFGSTKKMLVKHATGYKLWGTVPSGLKFDVERGMNVKFVATVEPSDRDPKFGFFSRPKAVA